MHGKSSDALFVDTQSLTYLSWYTSDFYEHATGFQELSGSLRIATKYEMPELRKWSISRLSELWPSLELLPSLPLKGPPRNAASAISIARECDVPDLLPAAFYSLSIEKWRNQGDENAHHILSSEDLRRLIVGREGLQALVDTFRATLDEDGALGDHYSCQSSLHRQWSRRLRSRPESPIGLCILRELQDMAFADVPSVCSSHLRMHRDLARDRVGMVIALIPNLFCI